MSFRDVFENYFNGFQEISNFRTNDCITNATATLKIASYLAIIPPIVFGIGYGATCLSERVSQCNPSSNQVQIIQQTSSSILLLSETTNPPKENSKITTDNFKKSLIEADTITSNSKKLKKYCEIAIEQLTVSQPNNANRALDLATECISDKGDLEKKIEQCCEIAQIRLKITPNKIPKELSKGSELEEIERSQNNTYEGAGDLLPLHVKPLCLLAKGYHLAGNLTKAKELIANAENCRDQNKTRTWEYLRNHVEIAKTQLQVTLLEDGLQTIDAVLSNIDDLRECAPEITILTDIAILLIPIDRSKAESVISKAESKYEPYKGKYEWANSNIQIEYARLELQKAKK